jgi:hypothetical protein
MNPVFLALLCIALVWMVLVICRRGFEEDLLRDDEIFQGGEYSVRLPRRALLDQCLSAGDLDYVRLRNSPALLRLFLQERRRLAVAWLRQTRREAHRLLRLHVSSVRFAADLRPAAELKLWFAVGLFSLVYAAMLAAVWWYGPLNTRRSLQSIQALSGILARLVDRIVASIIPANLPAMPAAGVIR